MRIERENPARIDELVGAIETTTPDEVSDRVEVAAQAQKAWARTSVEERTSAVRTAAAEVENHLDEIAELVARETGKVLGDARGESGFAVAVMRFYADRGVELLAEPTTDDARGRLQVRHRPFGVVGAVTPWNAPIILSLLKVAPALVAGNAIVVKPSPFAPFGVQTFLDKIAESLPSGLVQVVQGDVETASALVQHPAVSRVAFTGGDGAGRAIASMAGRALTPSVLELGGNDAAILLEDVALSDADAERLVMAAFATSGQVCMAIKRLYVHRSRFDEVVSQMRAAADRVLRMGDPLHAGNSMGPVVSAASMQRLEALTAQVRAGGAEVLPIGTLDASTDMTRGYFVRPSLVLGASDGDGIVAEEQFGPILPVLPFDSVEEVIGRANAGDLGLGASVWSTDEDHAFDIASRLDAGFTFVNTHNRTGMALHAPFGGVKRSGWGREYGDEGLLEYAQPCVIHAPAAYREGGSGSGAASYPGT